MPTREAEMQTGVRVKKRKVEPRGDSRGVDTLPLLGIVFPSLAKEPTKNKGCFSHDRQRDDEKEPGVYAK